MTDSKSTNLLSKYLLSPASNINYDFVASIYTFFSLLGIILYVLETQLFVYYSAETENETMKELAQSTKGLYMIFVPFIPCLFWSLVIRHKWKKCIVKKTKNE